MRPTAALSSPLVTLAAIAMSISATHAQASYFTYSITDNSPGYVTVNGINPQIGPYFADITTVSACEAACDAAAPGQCLLGLLQIPSNTPAEKGGCFLFPAGSGNVQLPVQRGDAVFAAYDFPGFIGGQAATCGEIYQDAFASTTSGPPTIECICGPGRVYPSDGSTLSCIRANSGVGGAPAPQPSRVRVKRQREHF